MESGTVFQPSGPAIQSPTAWTQGFANIVLQWQQYKDGKPDDDNGYQLAFFEGLDSLRNLAMPASEAHPTYSSSLAVPMNPSQVSEFQSAIFAAWPNDTSAYSIPFPISSCTASWWMEGEPTGVLDSLKVSKQSLTCIDSPCSGKRFDNHYCSDSHHQWQPPEQCITSLDHRTK